MVTNKIDFLDIQIKQIWVNMSKNMDFEEYMNKYNYNLVLNNLLKKFWTDFDYHRDRMSSVFSKIDKITWIEINGDLYENINNTPKCVLLECSRYCHRSYDKCYPNSDECHECFKYWCGCCGKGSNSMYFTCNGKRCTDFLNTIHGLFTNTTKRIYVFKRKNNSWDLLTERKKLPRDKETYGY